jgi:transcriptional regulator with XRE-family HTH domain
MTEGPIDWRAVVDEAIRRRKQDGLSQRDLAALAGVSVPTVNSFEKGDTNLRFDRVVAILDAVGLFLHPGESDSLQAFVHSARRRWSELVAELPEDDPSRQPHGHSEQAYAIEGQPLQPSLSDLREILTRAPANSGWPPFWVPTRASIRPTVRDGLVECWLGRPEADRAFADAAHSDFWQVSRGGKAYLQRGYQEDGPDLQPGTIFDVTLPIWRTAEVLIHAAWLARELGAAGKDKIRFSARYTGLAGRRLHAWAKPLLGTALWLGETATARTDTADLETVPTLEEIERELPSLVKQTLAPLYERFDGFEVPSDLVANQIEELRAFEHPTRPAGRHNRRSTARGRNR